MSDLLFTTTVPLFIAETEDEAADQWRLEARLHGHLPTGEPKVTTKTLHSDGELALWGGRAPWLVEGPVEAPEPPRATEKAVLAGAQALNARLHGTDKEWDDLPVHVRNYWMQTALDVITAAAPLLEVPGRGGVRP